MNKHRPFCEGPPRKDSVSDNAEPTNHMHSREDSFKTLYQKIALEDMKKIDENDGGNVMLIAWRSPDVEQSDDGEEPIIKHRKFCGPMKCPMVNCTMAVLPNSIYTHYLSGHLDEQIQCRETFNGKRVTLEFDVTSLKYDEIVCLGLLAYDGSKTQKIDPLTNKPVEMLETEPIATQTSAKKSNLKSPKNSKSPEEVSFSKKKFTNPYENYKNKLPVLIMISKISWSFDLGMKPNETTEKDSKRSSDDLLVIWLLNFDIDKQLDCTITAYDKSLTRSVSGIFEIRTFMDSQDPKSFVYDDYNHLRILEGQINKLSKNRQENIVLEVIVNQYEK